MSRQIDPQAIASQASQLNNDVHTLATRFSLALDLLEQWALAHPTDRHLVIQSRTLLQPSGRDVDHLAIRDEPGPAVLGDLVDRQTIRDALIASDPMQAVQGDVSIGTLAHLLAGVVARLPVSGPVPAAAGPQAREGG